MKPINVFSGFDGMSGGQLALQRAQIPVDKYYASEIDKHAIKITQKNFPNTIQLGDIEKWREWDIDWASINLLLAGSPCQGFSFAGKQLNFEDPRSRLFFIFVDIYNHVKKLNPDVKFLLENVNMKRSFLGVISKYMGVFPVRINSNLVSAQNRDRFYWSNIRTRHEGFFDDVFTYIPQPEDKGLVLLDILQPTEEVDEKYYMKDVEIQYGINKHSGKTWHTGNKMGNMDFPNKPKKKAKTLTTISIKGDRSVNHVGVNNYNGKLSKVEQSNCIDTNYWKGMDNHTQRSMVLSYDRIRRLTPIECERLQTVPDSYTEGVSDTQRYRMLGNGWTINVITHILNYLK